MVYHQLNGHEFGQTQEDNEGQGSLACGSSWGHKELDTTYQLNNNNHLYVESKIWEKLTYLQTRNRLTHAEDRLVVVKGEGGLGGKDWECGFSTCKLLFCGMGNQQVYPTG